MSNWAKAEAAVNTHFRKQYPKRIADLLAMARFDLNFGPCSADDYAAECPERETRWPGYVEAAEEIERYFADNVPSEVWYDADTGEVFDREPEGFWEECAPEDADEGEDGRRWCEPFWEEIYHVQNVHEVLLGSLYAYGGVRP